MLKGAAISHSSKLQFIVALSDFEAEYFDICEVEKDAVWLGYLLAELGFWKGLSRSHYTLTIKAQSPCQTIPNFTVAQIILMCDFTHWIREEVSMKQLNIVFIPIAKMAAEGLTKILPSSSFLEFRRMIGIDSGS